MLTYKNNKMLSYHRETALQGASVLAKSGRLELQDNILRTL